MEAILDVLLPFLAGIVIVGLITAIIHAICMWRIFNKLGQPGWKALIPFLSRFTLFDTVWGRGMAVVQLIISLLIAPLSGFNIALMSVVAAVFTIVTIVLSVLVTYRMVLALGRHPAWTALGVLCPPIFNLIMAFTG